MKKGVALVLCFLILCVSFAASAEGAMMQVVNCSEWVSLRKEPDSDSIRLLKVPLNAVVEECSAAENGFIYCRYHGFFGYVAQEYLAPYTPSAETEAVGQPEGADSLPQNAPAAGQTILDVLPEFPSYEIFTEAGTEVLETEVDGYRIVVRRAGKTTHERIMAVCYDQSGTPLWTISEASDTLTELTKTTAFLAGTAQKPLLVIFISGKGFQAYQIGSWTQMEWKCAADEALHISGGLSTQVDENGTIYACGYYNNAPICIGPSGALLWAAKNSRTDVQHPWKLELTNDALIMYCDELGEYPGVYNVASFDLSGNLIQVYQSEVES